MRKLVQSFFQVVRRRVSHQEVAFLVQSQVVRTREAAFTVGALEWFDSCVLAEVSGQLIWTGELPGAAFPHALVGFLTCRYRENVGVWSVTGFWRLAKYSLCMKADPYRCVSCGVPWGENSWCTLCCSRRSRSGEFASFSVCQEIQQGEDAVCPNELLLMGY